jgi:hypothetical protein
MSEPLLYTENVFLWLNAKSNSFQQFPFKKPNATIREKEKLALML